MDEIDNKLAKIEKDATILDMKLGKLGTDMFSRIAELMSITKQLRREVVELRKEIWEKAYDAEKEGGVDE